MDPSDMQAPNREEAPEFYNRYELGEIIGVGTSVVRYCTLTETGEDFAVKIIEKPDDNDENLDAFIFSERKVLRHLGHHQTIIRLQDTFDLTNHFFIVFELAKYGELFELLTEKVFVSEDVSRMYMKQILEGVTYIHDRKVVHRDLKLENILMMDEDVLKLSDFGFAIQVEEEVKLTELCGTPGYLAPEMIRAALHGVDKNNTGYSYSVDMWAVGVILYTLLVGFPPFWHSNRMVLMRQIMRGKIEFLSPYWDSVSDLGKKFVRQLLEINPDKRLTAHQAMAHPWMQINQQDIHSTRRFKIVALAVIALCRLNRMKNRMKPKERKQEVQVPESYNAVTDTMYKDMRIRKAIDECAFKIYGHWVKRSNAQNRAALFESYLPRIV